MLLIYLSSLVQQQVEHVSQRLIGFLKNWTKIFVFFNDGDNYYNYNLRKTDFCCNNAVTVYVYIWFLYLFDERVLTCQPVEKKKILRAVDRCSIFVFIMFNKKLLSQTVRGGKTFSFLLFLHETREQRVESAHRATFSRWIIQGCTRPSEGAALLIFSPQLQKRNKS